MSLAYVGSLDHTGFAPAHDVCAFPVYTAQAPGCYARVLSKRALRFVHFPGLSRPGSRGLRTGTGQDGPGVLCPSPVGAAPMTRCLASALSHGAVCLNHCPGHLVSQVRPESTVSGVPCVSSGKLISGCSTPGRCQPSRIPGRCGKQPGACSPLVDDAPSGAEIAAAPCLLAPGVASLPLCLQGGEGPVCSRLALLWYWLSPLFCAVSLSYLPQIVLGHSGPFLSLRTNDAARTSLPSPCSLVADRKFWAISLLTFVVRRLFCVLFFFSSLFCCPLRFQSSPQTHL